MVITQEELIQEIAENENIDIGTVRNIFKSAENMVFSHLSSATSSEGIIIKILNGLSLESEFIPKHQINKGIFQNHDCPERIKVKSSITKYYNKKLNWR